MASSVYYKFKAQKNESRIAFDGTGISVFDLKKEIILANNLKANDFDLYLYDTNDQEYKDDSQIIPRSSSVIAKRMPAGRPGKGKAAMYIGSASTAGPSDHRPDNSSKPQVASWNSRGFGAMSKRFDGKDEKPRPQHSSTPTAPSAEASAPMPSLSTQTDEEKERIKAMFQAETENWEETQERMSQFVLIPYNYPSPFKSIHSHKHDLFAFTPSRGVSNVRSATPIYNQRHTTGPRKPYVPHQQAQQHYEPKPLPPGYVCHRCSKKGHWIQDCPTNDDREFDNRPRIKRTTGIPRSFLKAVEMPSDGPLSQGVMVTPEGGFVVAQPDSAAWQKQRAKPKGLTVSDIRDKTPTDPSLACGICNKLIRDAVQTPCCKHVYCEDCIQTHLLDHEFICPSCQIKVSSLTELRPAEGVRSRVNAYIEKAIEESRKEAESNSRDGTPAPAEDSNTKEAPGNQAEGGSQEAEFTFDEQPGNVQNQGVPFNPEVAQIQAQMPQLMMMAQDPNVPMPMRMQAQMQLEACTMRLQQIEMMSYYNNVGTSGGMGMDRSMNGQAAGDFNNNQQFKKGEYRPNWTNPFPNQQPAGQESAYQRLPVNNRRRGQKRERPSDILEVGGDGGQSKVARYWE